MVKCYTTRKRRKAPRIRFENALLVAQIFFLIVLSLIALSTVVFAADTSDAQYLGIVRITNNSTAETAVSVPCTIFTQELIDAGFINTSCNNTATLTPASADTAYMPAKSGNSSWAFWVPSIAKLDVIDYRLYTGGANDMAGKIRYFPGPGGMTTPDSMSLEGSGNFTIEQKGRVDTDNGSDKNLAYKPGAFVSEISDTVSGNITSAIAVYTTPTGHDDPSTAWTTETFAYDNNTGTKAEAGGITGWSGYLELSHAAIQCDGLRYWAYTSAPDASDNISIDLYYSGGWHSLYNGAFTQGIWQYRIGDSLQNVSESRIRFYNAAGTSTYGLYEVDFIDFSDAAVTATGISSGEYAVKVTMTDNATETLTVTGAGDETNLNPVPSPPNWDRVETKSNDYVLANDPNVFERDLYTISNYSGSNATKSLIVYALAETNKVTPVTDTLKIVVKVSGTVYEGALQSVDPALTLYSEEWATNPSTGEDWTADEINNTQIGVNAKMTALGWGTYIWWVFATVEYGGLAIYIDEVEEDVIYSTASVPDNFANWTFLENNAMPYMEYQDISVNGTQVQYIEWENATTFSDPSGYGNDATPTFRTTSSDPHVSAELISFKPIAESEATGWDVTLAKTMIGTPTAGVSGEGPIPEMFTENVTAHLPGAGFFNAMIVAGGVSWALFWIPFCFIIVIVIGVLTFGATRSLGVQAAIMAFGIAFFATLGPIPFVPVIIFVIDSVAVIMMSKQIGW